MKNFWVYKTTNMINGKIYIGCSTRKLSDVNYLGSGLLLRKSIRKHGRNNFKREILEICDSVKQMYMIEKLMIDKFSSRDLTIGYNIAKGGSGGDTMSTNPNKDEIYRKQSLSRKNSTYKPSQKSIDQRVNSYIKTITDNPEIVLKRNMKLCAPVEIHDVKYDSIGQAYNELKIIDLSLTSMKIFIKRLNDRHNINYVRIKPIIKNKEINNL